MNLQQVSSEFHSLSPDTASLPRDCRPVRVGEKCRSHENTGECGEENKIIGNFKRNK